MARFSITLVLLLVFVAVALVHARPQSLAPSNQIGGSDQLIQQGRNMLAKFILKDSQMNTNRFKRQHGCYRNIFKECNKDADCGCHIKCMRTMKNDRIVKRCIAPTYPLIR